MRTIIIGVTGASSSGKSTLAYLLKSILPSTEIIHQDDFFKLEKDVPYDPIRKDRDWDCPDAIDMDAMTQTLRVLLDPLKFGSNPKAVVRDSGNGYYNYAMSSTEPPRNDANFTNKDTVVDQLRNQVESKLKSLSNDMNFRIFLLDGFLILPDTNLLEMLKITLFFKTNYQSLKYRREKRLYTVEGNVWVDPPGYFDTFVWPGYYKYHKDLFLSGDQESFVKQTGGNLKPDFKKQYRIYEFENSDSCDADELLENVTNVVIENVFN